MMLVECTRRSFIIVICNVNQSSPYSDFETTYADIYHGRPLLIVAIPTLIQTFASGSV